MLRKRIAQFYETNKMHGKVFTVNHFLSEGFSRSNIYNVLKMIGNNECIERKPGSGRIPVIFDKKGTNNLKKMFDGKDKISTRYAARKFKCNHSTIVKKLKKMNIKCRKKVKSPKYSDAQIKTVKTQCNFMYKNFGKKCFILDDEKYFTLSASQMPGNNTYYTGNPSQVVNEVKYKGKVKYEKKILLYIAISENGISKPFLYPSGLAIDKTMYIKCLKKILLPFITKHGDTDYIFWPDKASCHYAYETIAFLQSKNIPFVPKNRNPSNLPQARPIEDFFGLLSSKVYANGWEAQNISTLKRRIKKCIKEIDISVVQDSCRSIASKLRKIGREGPFSTCH